jgi:hypothetical protein
MTEKNNLVGRDQSSSLFDEGLLPRVAPHPRARIREELVPGLWQFEDETGQLYLAVKSPEWHPTRGGDLGARW